MNIIFMGTPVFAEIILQSMIDNDFLPCAVVTQPDRASGRGRKISMSPVKILAEKYNIPVLQPVKARGKNFYEELMKFKPELLVVAAYGQILSGKLLRMPVYGGVNVHASILPDYRGSSPVQRVIADGKTFSGVTLMQMNEEIDCGDIIMTSQVDILPEDDSGTLEIKLARSGGELLCNALKTGISTLKRTRQDLSCGKYYPKITREDGIIDFNNSAKSIFDLVRAMYPWPTAYCYFRGNLVKLIKTAVSSENYPGKIGEIVRVDPKNGLFVKTSDGILNIKRVRPENKKEMDASDFSRGARILKGEFFESGKSGS